MGAVEYILIAFLVLLQFYVFFDVLVKIRKLKHFFPDSFFGIEIKRFLIPVEVLNDKHAFPGYINTVGEKELIENSNESESEAVELLVVPKQIQKEHPAFYDVIKSTNAYLSKNKGASADFNILQDICERHLQKLDNGIGNMINVPLYIGLAGTFLGIIIGLKGIDFSTPFGDSTVSISSDSIQQLLNGVVAAMIASLVGLGFTVVSTALFYKPASYINETNKNHYYDFLQRELLPVLNVGMAGSLTTFRSVLNHFIQQFGENIEDYSDSAVLLNDNLQKQHLLLEEINKLSISKTSIEIAKTFASLRESSEHLETFKSYQKGLNENLQSTNKAVQEINHVVTQFKDFNQNLKSISTHTLTSIELQNQFKLSLEKHFPVVEDHRAVWRKHVDELNSDVKGVYKELNEYIRISTIQMQNFIRENNTLFDSLDTIQQSVKIFADTAIAQHSQYKELQNTLFDMRNDFRESQKQSIETNKEIVEALKSFNKNMVKRELEEKQIN